MRAFRPVPLRAPWKEQPLPSLSHPCSFADGKYLALGSHDNFVYIYLVSEGGRKYGRVGRCSVSGDLLLPPPPAFLRVSSSGTLWGGGGGGGGCSADLATMSVPREEEGEVLVTQQVASRGSCSATHVGSILCLPLQEMCWKYVCGRGEVVSLFFKERSYPLEVPCPSRGGWGNPLLHQWTNFGGIICLGPERMSASEHAQSAFVSAPKGVPLMPHFFLGGRNAEMSRSPRTSGSAPLAGNLFLRAVLPHPTHPTPVSFQGHSSFITHLDWAFDSSCLVTNSGDYEILYCE